jgi:outer membrane lipoprotein-sorting protein
MELNEIMDELKSLGTERTKKIYMSNGAKEPVFGVTISAMKPIFKKIKYNQPLAEQLYATGNYDAMYLAGMIAEPKKMFCLLYTSPSPRDRQKSRMPSSA